MLALWLAVAVTGGVTGGIHGHVYTLDGAQPLEGVRITIERQIPPETVYAASAFDGSFHVPDLEPGSYRLYCEKRGFVPANYGERKPGYGAQFVNVASGRISDGIDFYLTRSAAVSGRVIDEDGEPISGVTVTLSTRAFLQGKPLYRAVAHASTDDRGQYRLHSILPDRYYVQAEMRQDTTIGAGVSPGPVIVNVDGSVTFNIKPSSTRHLGASEARLVQPGPGSEVNGIDFLLRSEELYTVTGRIEDGSGKTLTPDSISLFATQETISRTTSAAILSDGSFVARNLTPTVHTVVFYTHEGADVKRYDRVLDLRSGAPSSVVFRVGPGATVRGKVQAEGGELPKNVHVNFKPRTDSLMGRVSSDAVVGEDGSFEVAGLQPGLYDLVAYTIPHNSDVGFFVSHAQAGDQDFAEDGLLVGDADDKITLNATVDFRGAVVSGRVLDESDRALGGISVVLASSDPKRRAGDRYQRWSVTEKDGKFRLTGIIPADYILLLWPDDDPLATQDPELIQRLEPYGVRLTVKERERVTVDLQFPASLRDFAKTVY